MEKDNTKTSRADQTRTKSERPKVWVPPSSLDAPPAPDGFRYRWIRAEVIGFQDTKNITGRIREGWPSTCEGTCRDREAKTRLYVE
jgi:hypothetical protein